MFLDRNRKRDDFELNFNRKLPIISSAASLLSLPPTLRYLTTV
jgi:hypothetical protein